MVGKLFPTTDPEPHAAAADGELHHPGGHRRRGHRSSTTRSCGTRRTPPCRAAARQGSPLLTGSGSISEGRSRRPTIRQLYQIAELGKPPPSRRARPSSCELTVARAAGHPRRRPRLPRRDHGPDLRPRRPPPKRTLMFDIEVSDDGQTTGLLQHAPDISNWRRIGTMVFDNAVVSYNGDDVIHFNHPTWREDRNDPTTATRINGEEVGHRVVIRGPFRKRTSDGLRDPPPGIVAQVAPLRSQRGSSHLRPLLV